MRAARGFAGISRAARAPLLSVAVAASCTTDPAETDTAPRDTDPVLPTDTDGTDTSDTGEPSTAHTGPQHWLTITQQGEWHLTPAGGPYDALTGNLRATETLDPPDTTSMSCDVTYRLTGTPAATHSCSSCDPVFDVLYELQSGDPGGCREPDLPPDGHTARMGFDAAAGAILLDYLDLGLWIPWYEAAQTGDDIAFEWVRTVGVYVDGT